MKRQRTDRAERRRYETRFAKGAADLQDMGVATNFETIIK